MRTDQHIKDIVKERAKEKGISLVALSFLVGVSYSHLRYVLRGVYVSHPVIQKIAQILDLPDLPQQYEEFVKQVRGSHTHTKSFSLSHVENHPQDSARESQSRKEEEER